MWFKHRAWEPVAWILSALNLAAVWFAAQPAEPWHATVHALAAAGLGLGARHLTVRRRMNALNEQIQETLDLNEHIQQTLEATEARLHELEERVDFAERLLAQYRDANRLEPPS